MNILLATHIALWAITDDAKLSAKGREHLMASRNTLWVSCATVWEISIKHSLGRGQMPISGQQLIDFFRDAGFHFLPIEPEHAAAIEGLPDIHPDPFDRLLVAQTLTEPMRLLAHDATVARYSDTIMLV